MNRKGRQDIIGLKYRSHRHFNQEIYHWRNVCHQIHNDDSYLFLFRFLWFYCPLNGILFLGVLWSHLTSTCICLSCILKGCYQVQVFGCYCLLRDRHKWHELRSNCCGLLHCFQTSMLQSLWCNCCSSILGRCGRRSESFHPQSQRIIVWVDLFGWQTSRLGLEFI